MGPDMSRSYRKPYSPWCSGSMREDKKIYHGRHRARVKAVLDTAQDFDEVYTPVKNIETSNVCTMARDGKQYYVEIPRDCDNNWYKEFYKKVKRK